MPLQPPSPATLSLGFQGQAGQVACGHQAAGRLPHISTQRWASAGPAFSKCLTNKVEHPQQQPEPSRLVEADPAPPLQPLSPLRRNFWAAVYPAPPSATRPTSTFAGHLLSTGPLLREAPLTAQLKEPPPRHSPQQPVLSSSLQCLEASGSPGGLLTFCLSPQPLTAAQGEGDLL